MSAPAGWVQRWIGRPWVAGSGDCWSLARAVWAAEFGREVPPLPVDPEALLPAVRALREGRGRWAEVPAGGRADGDAALMARGAHPCHVGIWVRPTPPGREWRVLHALRGAGAVCTPAGRLGETGYRPVATLRLPEWGEAR